MKRAIFATVELIVAIGLVLPLNARNVILLSYRELFDRSDLIVIATPTGRTADTAEVSHLPNIATQYAPGVGIEIASVGVETPFKVAVVLKGAQDVDQFVLHHYREVSTGRALNGPALLHFDPSDLGSYIMFLIREPDGRYAPTGGQTDPGLNSVTRVPIDRLAASSLPPR